MTPTLESPASAHFRACGGPLGAIAQLGERLVRNEEVGGSIPPGSTTRLPRDRISPTGYRTRMSTTLGGEVTAQDRAAKIAKYVARRILFPLGVLAPFAFFFPKIALFYAICGAYDIT